MTARTTLPVPAATPAPLPRCASCNALGSVFHDGEPAGFGGPICCSCHGCASCIGDEEYEAMGPGEVVEDKPTRARLRGRLLDLAYAIEHVPADELADIDDRNPSFHRDRVAGELRAAAKRVESGETEDAYAVLCGTADLVALLAAPPALLKGVRDVEDLLLHGLDDDEAERNPGWRDVLRRHDEAVARLKASVAPEVK